MELSADTHAGDIVCKKGRPTVNREHNFRSKLYSVDKCDFKEDDFEPPGSDLMKKI